jgi:hypothetical protein
MRLAKRKKNSKSSRWSQIETEDAIPLALSLRILLLLTFPRVTSHNRSPRVRAICAGDPQIELFNVIDSIWEMKLIGLVGAVVGLISSHAN